MAKESTDMGKMMFELSTQAWNDAMKEKIQAIYEHEMGDMMDKTAQIAADFSSKVWMAKMQGKELSKKEWAEFNASLMKSMSP